MSRPVVRGRQDVQGAWIVLTGGEPALELDADLCERFHDAGFMLAIETNGSIELPRRPVETASGSTATEDERPLADRLGRFQIDWITVSPKVAEHAIRQRVAHEVKYVRAYGQAIPRTVVEAMHYVISPAFDGDFLDPETLDWCKDLVKQNPPWRLSVQQHKGWREEPSLQVLPADPPAPSADFKSVRKESAHVDRGWCVEQDFVAEKYFARGAEVLALQGESADLVAGEAGSVERCRAHARQRRKGRR